MGSLTESSLDAIVQAGCTACGNSRLMFRAYLDARLPILGGEPVGKLSWCYDGEKFIDGVYEIFCADCKKNLFSDSMCPRCHQAGGCVLALATENRFARLGECPSCQGEELRYFAMLPATVAYEKKRAAPPRTETDAYDPGFHGYRVDCTDCGTVAEVVERCPLCDFSGPLRPRPG